MSRKREERKKKKQLTIKQPGWFKTEIQPMRWKGSVSGDPMALRQRLEAPLLSSPLTGLCRLNRWRRLAPFGAVYLLALLRPYHLLRPVRSYVQGSSEEPLVHPPTAFTASLGTGPATSPATWLLWPYVTTPELAYIFVLAFACSTIET